NIENELNLSHGTLQEYNPTADPKNLKIGSQINVGDPTSYNNFRDMTISEFTGINDDQGNFNMTFDNSGELNEVYTDRMASDQQLNELMSFAFFNAALPVGIGAGMGTTSIPSRSPKIFS